MKRNKLVTLVSVLLVVLLLTSSTTAFAVSESPETLRYQNILFTAVSLDIGTWGLAECYGEAVLYNPYYTVSILMELKNATTWTTVESWSGFDFEEIQLLGYEYVNYGSYQVKLTVTVYDMDGQLVETQYAYSHVVQY